MAWKQLQLFNNGSRPIIIDMKMPVLDGGATIKKWPL